jgi:ATP synthase protein I
MTTAQPTPPASSGSAPRRARMVLGPLSAVLLVGLVLAVAASLVAGLPAATGVVLGAGLVAAVFSSGAVVLGMVTLVAPSVSLLVALLTYTLQVVLVGVFYLALSRGGVLDATVDPRWLSAAVIAGTLAWTTTQIVVTTRSRQLAYDLPSQGAEASVR